MSQYPLIPKQAFLFFPPPEDVCQNKDSRPRRFIFEGGVEFTAFEKEQLKIIHKCIHEQSSIHHLKFFSESTLLRFLQANKYDAEQTLKELKQYKKWQDRTLPLNLTPQIEKLLKAGMFYITGRDCNYRPIIVVNVPVIMQLDLEQKIFLEAAGYFFQFVVENCMIEGQIQNWVTIVDLGEIGMFSLAGTILNIIGFLSKHFKCRLYHNYLLNCPGSLKFVFGMAKAAMTQEQVNKISLVQESSLPQQAFSYIFQQDIEIKYGGWRSNIKQFWPINTQITKRRLRVQSETAGVEQNQMIDVEQYGQMHSKGQLLLKKISRELLGEYEKIVRERKEKKQAQQLAQSVRRVNQQMQQQLALIVEKQPPMCPEIPAPISCHSFLKALFSK